MTKATIEITSTGERKKISINVSFDGGMDIEDPAHITAIRIAEALYQSGPVTVNDRELEETRH